MGDIKTHEDFLMKNFRYYIFQDRSNSAAELDPPDYQSPPPRLCPEPLTFLKEFDDISNDSAACISKFNQKMSGFRTAPEFNPKMPLWFNTTRKGINLRPGIFVGTGKPSAVRLGDVCVHGLMAGQTGSGKSVLLNDIIFNMLTEYSPWELDLYLADFKKVEFSRYMNKKEWVTPHVNACAATSEIRYVLSMIQHLVDCMNAREELFSRLGCDKIAAFREQYQIVLPRILLIVDEFQQMFLEASAKEGEQIRRMLTAIVKKGRATGVHVLFASQEMSQTLSRSDLANFRLRIALNCTPNVSMDVLGNRAASRIQRGHVLINMTDGSERTNMDYQVPLIETDATEGERSYFDQYLSQLYTISRNCGFSKPGKFYKEDEQRPISDLEEVLGRIRDFRGGIYKSSKQEYYDILTLGRCVTYSDRKYDIQTLYLSRGRNRNILAVSPNPDDLTYLQRLFALNFNTSPRKDVTGVNYVHEVFSLQPVLRSLYQVERDLGTDVVRTSPDDLLSLEQTFKEKRFLMQLIQECSTPLEFVVMNYKKNLDQLRRLRRTEEANALENTEIPRLAQLFGNVALEDVPELCEKILKTNKEMHITRLAQNLMKFYTYQKNPYEVFVPTVYWISGIDSVERIPDWLFWMMKNGMDYNILFILMAGSDFDQMTQTAKYCDYLFLGGNNRTNYDRLNVNFTHKSADSIALDLYIKSNGEERSFKKYKCGSTERITSPSINFDVILGSE